MPDYLVTDIEIREDGVYLLINHNSPNPKDDVLNIIQRYQVKDVDYEAVESALSNKKEEQKISSNLDIASRNESIDIDISSNKMSVSIKFNEPINGGTLLTKSDVITILNNTGIHYGIKEDVIEKLIEKKKYKSYYEVATGDEPIDGIDGYLEFFFETKKKSLKPKLLADGSVDYRNLHLIDIAKEEQILVKSHPSIQGKEGMNVFAKIIQSRHPKPPSALPRGKNTKVLEDGATLVAEISGRLLYMDGRVNILPILEIQGNVDNGTGNVEFIGTIIVKGNVVTGFSITAGADVEVEGSVEGAAITAKGNVILMKGVQGGNKAVIDAGLDITANFVENATITAKGNIIANSIMHSNVRCGGSLELIGKRGLIVGGKIIVGEKITAKIIGSSMSTLTELEVGIDPSILEEYRENVRAIEAYTQDYKKTEKIIEMLSKVNISSLSDDKKRILMDAIRSKIMLKSKINAAQLKVDQQIASLNRKNGKIEANEVIYSGVKVMINNAVMYIRDDLSFVSLYNKEGKVCIGSFG